MAMYPASLKPMCPMRPMPRSCKSMPPAALMAASYASQYLQQHSLEGRARLHKVHECHQ